MWALRWHPPLICGIMGLQQRPAQQSIVDQVAAFIATLNSELQGQSNAQMSCPSPQRKLQKCCLVRLHGRQLDAQNHLLRLDSPPFGSPALSASCRKAAAHSSICANFDDLVKDMAPPTRRYEEVVWWTISPEIAPHVAFTPAQQ